MSILEEYKAYYKARMTRYTNNSLYPFSYQSEKAISEAMDSCGILEDFKAKLEAGNLNIKNGIALLKDKYNARIKHYDALEEKIRVLGPRRIIEKVDEAKTDMDMIQIVLDIEHENSMEITADEFTSSFYSSIWKKLENIEEYEKAEVPEKYKAGFLKNAEEEKERLRKYYVDESKNNIAWKADWKFDYDLLWEKRHRRKIPMSDEVLQKKINQTKEIRGIN
ncbi:MAG: hypothetical protein KAR07_02875 [Spirochaetes bacterium]|nr:hypothetical protein [Spirochaetota bacterium]MCK5267089.1 hypothetical protein [Spirochaetota bacterium]